jgi:hypothetical protein
MLSAGKMEMLTRVGFAARGIMYVLIGFLAVRLGRNEDGAGAMAALDSGPWRFLLALMAAGFLGYGLWRLSEAATDTEGNGSGAKGIAIRIGGAVSGLVHLGLSFYALTLALGSRGGSGGGAQETAATVLDQPVGWLALLLAGLALAATGLFQLIKAAKRDFLRHLSPEASRQPWVGWLGSGGYAARGIVFAVMGWFLFQAGRDARASEAGGMGEALSWLSGPMQTLVAAGLLLFGLFSFVEARYRRINDPGVLDRLARAAQR